MFKKTLFLILGLLISCGLVFAFTYDWTIDSMEYPTDETCQAAFVSSDGVLLPDILNEDCSDISDWTIEDAGTAVSEVSPVGQFRLDTNAGAAGNAYCALVPTSAPDTPPNKFTIEIKTYFDSIGTQANTDFLKVRYKSTTWRFEAQFCSDGLFIEKAGAAFGEVGTNLVKEGGSAAWQTWRFEVDKTTESTATVEVFLDNVSQGTVDCDYEVGSGAQTLAIYQYGYTTNDMVTHIDYIKIANGLGAIGSLQCYSEDTIIQQGTYSLKVVAAITDSLNDTLTKTLTDYKDLSNAEGIEYDIYALRTGSNIKIGLHDSGGTTSEHTANVAESNTNQTESWDVSEIADANKDDIDSIIVTIVNADAANTFYLDDLKFGITPAAAGGGSWGFVN